MIRAWIRAWWERHVPLDIDPEPSWLDLMNGVGVSQAEAAFDAAVEAHFTAAP